jgi:hypothetical protein
MEKKFKVAHSLFLLLAHKLHVLLVAVAAVDTAVVAVVAAVAAADSVAQSSCGRVMIFFNSEFS